MLLAALRPSKFLLRGILVFPFLSMEYHRLKLSTPLTLLQQNGPGCLHTVPPDGHQLLVAL